MNCFNKDKISCAFCGQKGNNVDGCLQLKNTDMEIAYIRFLIFVSCFVKGLKKMYTSSTKHNQDLQSVQSLTLSELNALEHVDLMSIS